MDECQYIAPDELCGRPRFYGKLHRRELLPSQLLTSTIADELKVATRNKGMVYAIAPRAMQLSLPPDTPETVRSG